MSLALSPFLPALFLCGYEGIRSLFIEINGQLASSPLLFFTSGFATKGVLYRVSPYLPPPTFNILLISLVFAVSILFSQLPVSSFPFKPSEKLGTPSLPI